MKKLVFATTILCLLLAASANSVAQEANASGSEIPIVIHDDIRIVYDPTNTYPYKAVVAYGEASMDFMDREGIREAKKEAELYAKQRLAKFMNEEVSSEDTLNKMVKTIKKQSNDSKSVTKTTLKEQATVIRNSAHAVLKGCIPVKTIVNKEEEYVGVEYGFNQKTMRLADYIKADMKRDFSRRVTKKAGATSGSYTQKSSMAKDFE